MNIQMRIITDANVDKLLGLSYSNNISKLLQTDKSPKDIIPDYVANIKYKLSNTKREYLVPGEEPVLPGNSELTENEYEYEYESYKPNSPEYFGDPNSPNYVGNINDIKTPDYLIEEELINGNIQIKPRFSPLLNSIFANMSKTDKIMLVNKSIEEQVEELKRLYKIEFLKKPVEQQDAIIKKLTYNNSKYDVDRLAEYLTNSNNNSTEEGEFKINLEEELLNTPLIKKDSSSNSSEVVSNLETNILNVEPEIQPEEPKKESDGANNSEGESDNSKKVSFSEVDTSSSDSSNTNTTKTIKL
jgi:hypothetical protein